jgi:hypothetical protein
MSKSIGEWIRWDLPGIFTACSATYEESSLVWLSRSTVSLSLKGSKFRNMLNQVQVETRGLRSNKVTEECKDFMQSLTQFSGITIKLEHEYGNPKGSQALPLAAAPDFFSKLDYFEGKRIDVDLLNLYGLFAIEANAVVKCVREWMDKFPALHLKLHNPAEYAPYSMYNIASSRYPAKKLHEDLVADYKGRVTETDRY